MTAYLVVYLALGAFVLIALHATGRSARGDTRPLRVPALAHPSPQDQGPRSNRLEQVLRGMLLPPVAAILGWIVWPALIVCTVRHEIAQAMREQGDAFAVTRADLVRPMTVAEIERLERVADPLGAAPPVPFGFRNTQWLDFIADLQPSDTIWSFHAQRSDGLHQVVREGYVLLLGRTVGPHFLTSFRPVADA